MSKDAFFLFFRLPFVCLSEQLRERREKKTQKLDVVKKATEKSSFALRQQKQKRKQKVPLTSKRHERNEEFAQPHELPWRAYSVYTMLLIFFLLSIRTPLGWRRQKRAKNSLLTASPRRDVHIYIIINKICYKSPSTITHLSRRFLRRFRTLAESVLESSR